MAVTDYSFLEIDASDANDIPLKGHHTCTFTPTPVTVPAPEAPDSVIGLDKYTESWTWTNVAMTQAEYETRLKATARTACSKTGTYPRLNVITSSTPTWTQYPVEIGPVTDGAMDGDGVTRFVTVLFRRRSTSGSLTFVVDSGGSNAVTLDLMQMEAAKQLLSFTPPPTLTGDGESTVGGARALTASVVGYAATGDIDKLQKVLDYCYATGPVEMVGVCFDTTGGGYLATELPAASTAYLISLDVAARVGAKALVTVGISHDRA